VNGHVENQATTLDRIHVVAWRTEWIAADCLKGDRVSNLTSSDQGFGPLVSRIEATHKADLERYLRSCDGFQHRAGLFERQSQRFFTEDCFARFCSSHDQVMMCTGRCSDNDSVHSRKCYQFIGIREHMGYTQFVCNLRPRLPVYFRDPVQLDSRDLGCKHACV
jgi:hypothetical protein